MKRRFSLARQCGRKRLAGVTLVECCTGLAVLAVLAGLAAPSFKPLQERWRVQQSLDSLTDTLALSRAAAIQRGGRIVLQKIPDHTDGCTLAATPADWGCGWRLFVDSDANGRYDTGEVLLQSFSIPPGIRVTHGNGAAAIALDRWGQMDGLHAKRFVVFPAGEAVGSAATRSLCIAAGGRIRTSKGATCAAPDSKASR